MARNWRYLSKPELWDKKEESYGLLGFGVRKGYQTSINEANRRLDRIEAILREREEPSR